LPVDFSTVTMDDYVHDLESVAGQVAAARGRHPVVAGWDMGGLVSMMYVAAQPETPALVLFSPSPPEEVAGRADPEVVRQTPAATYGPEVYGVFAGDPAASRAALHDLTDVEIDRVLKNSAGAEESGFARRQRRRGIKVAPGAIRCPSLVVYGEEDRHFAPDLNRRTALYLAADTIPVAGAGHWGVVYSEEKVALVAPKVDAWLRQNLSP
jgi:pimeloyl-ACP methyl ester carboxylesterase